MDGARKRIGLVVVMLTAALLLATFRATRVSLAGPAPEGTPRPDEIVLTSFPSGPRVFIKTTQWGVPSALLEWEANQMLKLREGGTYSFRGSSPVPFTGLSVGWIATDHDADPAEFEVAIRSRKGETPWTEWTHTRGDIGPDDSPSGLFWSHLYIPGDFGVHTEFEARVWPPIGASLTFVRISVADTSAGLRVTGFLGERIGKKAGSTLLPAAPLGPYIIPRSVWWGDLPLDELNSPRWTPSYENISHALIHHTVTSNNPPNPAQVVRSIWVYHANVREWGDIGYNFLIDHFGNIYHGRYNPELDTEDVIAAHAKSYNAGSMGVGLIGQFHPSYEDPPAAEPSPSALRSTESLLAWRFQQRGLDPLGQATLVDRFIYRIAGHRDVGDTTCPGDTLYALLPTIRTNVQALVVSTHTLTVNSSNPDSGVSVEVSPKDNDGQAGGVTPFTRTYSHDTLVTLSAPSTVEGNSFQKWQINGMDYASIPYVYVTMDDNYIMTAVYEKAQPSSVSISIRPVSSTVSVGGVFTLGIEMQASDQPVDEAEAHLDFDPTHLRVVDTNGVEVSAIREVTTSLDTVRQNTADNSEGTIDYAAEALGEPPSGIITLAFIPLKAITETKRTELSFAFTALRKTDVIFEGASVLDEHTDGSVAAVVYRNRVYLPLALKE